MDASQAAFLGMRRSGRITKEIAIVLSGGDAAGRQFSEQTKTLMLSKHGASIICHHKLIPEQEAYLRVTSNDREIEVRVCGEIGEREDGHIYGVAFADPTSDFWGIEFPPPEQFAKDVIAVTLECSGCHAQQTLQFDATEMDVYAVNEGALRYCSNCALSTIWKIATKRAAPKEAPAAAKADEAQAKPPEPEIFPLSVTPAAAPAPPQVQPNRRADRRMKVKCSACIRVSGMADEIAPCEDMSRGGFSFHSGRQYSEETMIEAAVPYTPAGTSIFVQAQIANVREIQKGKLFRYGVAYMRVTKR